AAERVGRVALIRALSAAAAPTEHEAAAATRSPAGSARTARPKTAKPSAPLGSARPAEAAAPAWATVAGADALRKLPRLRIELPEIDHRGAIVHQAAIERRRVIAAVDRDRIGLHGFDREALRQQPRHVLRFLGAALVDHRRGGVRLHAERLEPATGRAAAAAR